MSETAIRLKFSIEIEPDDPKFKETVWAAFDLLAVHVGKEKAQAMFEEALADAKNKATEAA